MQEYALYKGDELLSIGTIRKIAKEMGVKRDTIAYYKTPTYKGRTSEEKGRRLVSLEDEKEKDLSGLQSVKVKEK